MVGIIVVEDTQCFGPFAPVLQIVAAGARRSQNAGVGQHAEDRPACEGGAHQRQGRLDAFAQHAVVAGMGVH